MMHQHECRTIGGRPQRRVEPREAVLTLRSLIQSDRWDRGWNLLAAEYLVDVTPVLN